MSEAKTTLVKIGFGGYDELTWQSRFRDSEWDDADTWVSEDSVEISIEYEVETCDEIEIEFPFVVRTTDNVKRVFIGDVEYPLRRVNYGTRFIIPAGTFKFYYADRFKLPDVVLRYRKIRYCNFTIQGDLRIGGEVILEGYFTIQGDLRIGGEVILEGG